MNKNSSFDEWSFQCLWSMTNFFFKFPIESFVIFQSKRFLVLTVTPVMLFVALAFAAFIRRAARFFADPRVVVVVVVVVVAALDLVVVVVVVSHDAVDELLPVLL